MERYDDFDIINYRCTVSVTVRERFLNVILEHNYIEIFLKEGVKTQVPIVLSFILN